MLFYSATILKKYIYFLFQAVLLLKRLKKFLAKLFCTVIGLSTMAWDLCYCIARNALGAFNN